MHKVFIKESEYEELIQEGALDGYPSNVFTLVKSTRTSGTIGWKTNPKNGDHGKQSIPDNNPQFHQSHYRT